MDGNKKFDQAGSLSPGMYVIIEGEVCQVKGVEKSKPGKHGAAKIRATAMGLFKDVKKTLLKPVDGDIEIPIIDRGNGQVVALMGDRVQIMDQKDYATYEIEKPKDVQGLASGAEIEYIKWGDNIRITRKKG
ncbi:Translation initiation factor 5A [uncultured archaeon]|nr:Translation initiation factor 5A [uncultured archaeon]